MLWLSNVVVQAKTGFVLRNITSKSEVFKKQRHSHNNFISYVFIRTLPVSWRCISSCCIEVIYVMYFIPIHSVKISVYMSQEIKNITLLRDYCYVNAELNFDDEKRSQINFLGQIFYL